MKTMKMKFMRFAACTAFAAMRANSSWAKRTPPSEASKRMGRDPLGVDTDLFVRGNADAETLWQGLVHGANNQHPKQGATGRWGVADYNSLGYVAHDHGRHGTVARTLEYAYDDWCIWPMPETGATS